MPSSDTHDTLSQDTLNQDTLSTDEQQFLQRLAEHYTPSPLNPAQQAAFDRKLEERLASSTRRPFLRPATILVPAFAALLLWFVLPSQNTSPPKDLNTHTQPVIVAHSGSAGSAGSDELDGLDGSARSDGSDEVMANAPDSTSHTNLLTYAYYQSDSYAAEDENEDTAFLPDEYVALADAFELL